MSSRQVGEVGLTESGFLHHYVFNPSCASLHPGSPGLGKCLNGRDGAQPPPEVLMAGLSGGILS